MHSPKTTVRLSALLAASVSMPAWAGPVDIQAALDIVVYRDDGSFQFDDDITGGLRTHVRDRIAPNTTVTINPLFPDVENSTIDFTYSVQTVGDQRTVQFRWETELLDGFVRQPAVDRASQRPGGGTIDPKSFYALRWRVHRYADTPDGTPPGFSDDEYVAGTDVQTSYNFFDKDGNLVRTRSFTIGEPSPTSIFLPGRPDGTGNLLSPADPTFGRGIGGARIFERTLTYTVVPEPGSLALLGLGGIMAIRRRRRA